jgi:hypothetical protein
MLVTKTWLSLSKKRLLKTGKPKKVQRNALQSIKNTLKWGSFKKNWRNHLSWKLRTGDTFNYFQYNIWVKLLNLHKKTLYKKLHSQRLENLICLHSKLHTLLVLKLCPYFVFHCFENVQKFLNSNFEMVNIFHSFIHFLIDWSLNLFGGGVQITQKGNFEWQNKIW